MVKILIDIGHPAHVHLFREVINELKKNGHEIFTIVKDIQSAKQLLNHYGIDFFDIGGKKDSIFQKGLSQLKYNWRIFNFVRKYHINIGVGSSVHLAHVSKLTSMKSIILDDDDDEAEPLYAKYVHPFCDTLLSPDSLKGKRKKKETIYYSSFHELSYLHPNRFEPNTDSLKKIDLKQGDPFFVLRFNAFQAYHDKGIKGISLENKLFLVDFLKNYGKIFITTEREIEPELINHELKIPPEKIHSIIYYAKMLIGDSQTMTSEAAVLGTPVIKCNSFAGKLSVPNELENKYKLCYSFTPENFKEMLKKIRELLDVPDLKKEWQKRRKIMLSEKIDLTAFLVWLIENYPSSVDTMKKNHDYQWKFK
ncbi:MAG: DUF354 domain-containing protein [Candidatus Aminicenantes bacterium]|nr:DUF354 domain-containing protein [Candidatus Aminicenantes bacterium]